MKQDAWLLRLKQTCNEFAIELAECDEGRQFLDELPSVEYFTNQAKESGASQPEKCGRVLHSLLTDVGLLALALETNSNREGRKEAMDIRGGITCPPKHQPLKECRCE
jgi:hypothetical protein